jgi:hypothetical protein
MTHDERSPPAFVKTNAGPLQPRKRNHGLPHSHDLPHIPIPVPLVPQFELERVGERVASTSVGDKVLRRGTGGLEVPLCRRFPMRRWIVSLEISGDGDGSDLRGAYIAVKLCFWS